MLGIVAQGREAEMQVETASRVVDRMHLHGPDSDLFRDL